MTTGQIITRDSQVLVRLRPARDPVPGSLGRILTELLRVGRAHTGMAPRPPADGSSPAACPDTPSRRPGSASACAPLASGPCPDAGPPSSTSPPSLPTAVLADSLNLSPGTAVRWMHQQNPTGIATPLTSPEPAITKPDEYPRRSRTSRPIPQGWNKALYRFPGGLPAQDAARDHGAREHHHDPRPVRAPISRRDGPLHGPPR